MDKFPRLHASASFSMHSLAEGSEVLSESEEIKAVHILQKKASQDMGTRNFKDAIKFLSDALEIDEYNTQLLKDRIHAYVETGNFELALVDAEVLTSVDQTSFEAHYLLSNIYYQLERYEESIFECSVCLGLENSAVDIVIINLIDRCAKLVEISQATLLKIQEMHLSEQLCELGVLLYHAKYTKLCIQVLTSAEMFETHLLLRSKMRRCLTLANAHSSQGNRETAISFYKDCLSVALLSHEVHYQIKTLVNIAALYLHCNNIHQAIVYYEQLLAIKSEILNKYADSWNDNLEAGIHYNLCIAYKSIGDIASSKQHAVEYVDIKQRGDLQQQNFSEATYNAGVLCEMLGQYFEALDHYKSFYKHSKEEKNMAARIQAYACLGGIYATLENRGLSESFHDQSIVMSKKMGNQKLLLTCLEMKGDSMMQLQKYDMAIDCFNELSKTVGKTDAYKKVLSLTKLGHAYRLNDKIQYALFQFEEAESLAEENNFLDQLHFILFETSQIHQHSSLLSELDLAETNLKKIIPVLEAKIQGHKNDGTFCKNLLIDQIHACYKMYQNVLVKLAYKDKSLEACEALKQKTVTQFQSHVNAFTQSSIPSAITSLVNNQVIRFGALEIWNMQKICKTVDQQNSLVLVYSF